MPHRAPTDRVTLDIDRAGRVVIPKAVRLSHGLTAGRRLALETRGSLIVLEPLDPETVLIEQDDLLVIGGALVGDVPDHRTLREERASAQAEVPERKPSRRRRSERGRA